MFAFLFQPEETTTDGAAEAAAQGFEETKDETRETYQDIVSSFFQDIRDYVIDPSFLAKLIVAAFIIGAGLLFYRVITHDVPKVLRWRRRRRDAAPDAEAIASRKRRDTAITLVRNALRYVVLIVVGLLIVSLFLGDSIPAVAGATVLAAVLGFGAQSLLKDVIAGLSIVFEGQYVVGDFIEIHPPQGKTGIVEELGLRLTKIRALSGEVHYIPNGSIMGVTNYVSGRQRFNVEVQLSDAGAVEKVLNSLNEAAELYLTPPRLVQKEETDGRTRLRIVADVLPSMAWLVEENLTERVKAAAGEDALAAEPLVYKVDQANLRRVRDLIPEDAETNLPQEVAKKLK